MEKVIRFLTIIYFISVVSLTKFYLFNEIQIDEIGDVELFTAQPVLNLKTTTDEGEHKKEETVKILETTADYVLQKRNSKYTKWEPFPYTKFEELPEVSTFRSKNGGKKCTVVRFIFRGPDFYETDPYYVHMVEFAYVFKKDFEFNRQALFTVDQALRNNFVYAWDVTPPILNTEDSSMSESEAVPQYQQLNVPNLSINFTRMSMNVLETVKFKYETATPECHLLVIPKPGKAFAFDLKLSATPTEETVIVKKDEFRLI